MESFISTQYHILYIMLDYIKKSCVELKYHIFFKIGNSIKEESIIWNLGEVFLELTLP